MGSSRIGFLGGADGWRAGLGAAAAAALLAGGVPARAQEVAAPPAPAPEQVQVQRAPGQLGEEVLVGEIVVKGRRGARTESLEAREVRERGARDLGEALSALPSVDKVRKGGIANDLVLRGMKKDDVAVTVDGAKVHGACPSRMDPPAFHLDWAEVDVVQVKRGPFDVSQAGGLAGAIEVRTRRGQARPGAEVHLEGGSSGALSTSVTGSYGQPGYDVLVGGGYKEGGPYHTGDGRNITQVVPSTLNGAPNAARFRNTSDGQRAYEVASGFARIGVAPAEGQRVEVGYTRQSAPRALYPYLKMDGVADDTDRATVRWTADALGPVGVQVSGYYSRVAHDMTDVWRCSSARDAAACSGALGRDYSMGTFARSEVWGGQGEVRGGDAERWLAWRAGVDGAVRTWDNRTDRVNRMTGAYASERSIPDVQTSGLGLYAEGRHTLGGAGGRTRFIAGGRLDAARSSARVDRKALYKVYFASEDLSLTRDDVLFGGNAQVEHDLAPGLTAWTGYGHAERLPDPQERYMALSGMMGNPDWLGDPDVSPARSDEVDAGLTWKAPRVVVKAQAFHAWYANYITLASVRVTTPAGVRSGRTYANVSARTFGGEATARVGLPLDLFAGAGLSFTRGVNDTADTSLPEIPPLKATLSLRWDDGTFFAEAEEIYAARQGFVDRSLAEEPTAAFWTTGVKAGAGLRGVKVFAAVQNLFDRSYVEHLSYQRDPFAAGLKVPEPGRTFLLAAQYAR